MEKVKLWNEAGDDTPENQLIVGGNPTGISNLNENRFKWAGALYRKMTGNTWFPEKVSMVDDKNTISSLTPDEMEALKDTLSFLIFLDSYQCLNLPSIADYVTAPNVRNLLIIQAYQEVIHSQSYQYMLEALFPLTTRDEVYNRWRTNENLKSRIRFVASIGERFKESPTEENFFAVLAMNFILESIYFYQGFMFFDQLASRNKLVQSAVMIDYIRNDELTHIGIFTHMIRELIPDDKKDFIIDMVKTAVEHETDWANFVYGDKILGISQKSSAQYVQYLANHRLAMLRLPAAYPAVGLNNPYRHLDEKKRGNFFEASAITEYDRSESVSGWDSF